MKNFVAYSARALPRTVPLLVLEALLFLPCESWSQSIVASIPVDSATVAAVNHVTNKIYLEAAGGIVVIDGATQTATTLPNTETAANGTNTIGVDEATNKIYVAGSAGVLVIDGSTGAVTVVGTNPFYFAGLVVNSTTNKVYVAYNHYDSTTNPPTLYGCQIVVIDGATNATTTIADPNVGTALCLQLAVNTVTNKIYVSYSDANSITVIDGATNSTTTVPTPRMGFISYGIVVNTVTNAIYVNNASSIMTLDGANNATTSISTPEFAQSLAVNTTTNQVYFPFEYYSPPDNICSSAGLGSYGSGCLGVIDGATNAVSAVPFPELPTSPTNGVAVNEATNTIYVAGVLGSNIIEAGGIPAVVMIDGATNSVTRVIDPNDISSGDYQDAIAVNATTNMIYWLHPSTGTVTVIDGSATPATHTLGVIGSPYSVTSSPAGLNCGSGAISSCPQIVPRECYPVNLTYVDADLHDVCPQGAPTFPVGTVVHLSATQQIPGFEMTWYGACTGTGACDVTMNSDQWLDAEYQPAPTMVPNVVGLTLAPARQPITAAGFFEGYPTEQSSSTVPAGHLISQSPAAGASALGGSTINVVLSTGPGGGGGGGGGGAIDWLTLGALLGYWVRRGHASLSQRKSS